MVLGFYKYRLKKGMLNAIRLFKFRRNHSIGQGTEIDKDLVLLGKVHIGENVKVGHEVILGRNVAVGNSAVLNNIEVGSDSQIESGVICTGHGNGRIKIGANSYVGINNVLDWSSNITIGDFVHVAGPSTGLWTHSSAKQCLNSVPLSDKREGFRPTAPIFIENNVYIGGNCTIYPGITIGHHSIVAPNSAVTKDVPPHTMVGGVPAAIIKGL
jgi:maltose O-acetyltransferase